MYDKDLKVNAYTMVYAESLMEDMEYGIRRWVYIVSKIRKEYFNLLQITKMTKVKEFDVYDVDRQAECHKWNYLVGNDEIWYRFAVNNVVDETEPLYKNEEDARRGLYEHLLAVNAEISLLPTYDELKWD